MPDNSEFRFRGISPTASNVVYNDEVYTVNTIPLAVPINVPVASSNYIAFDERHHFHINHVAEIYNNYLATFLEPKPQVKKIKRNLPDWF